MDSINTMLIIDVIIIILGMYLLFLSFRMKNTKKVEGFVVPEELLKRCKQEQEFAEYLSIRQMIFSIIMIAGGVLMVIHELIINFGYWYYLVAGVVAIAFIIYYKQLSDGRIKYC